MAWRRPGDKPLSEPMMVNLPTHICVSRPQWVNKDRLCIFDLSNIVLCSQMTWFQNDDNFVSERPNNLKFDYEYLYNAICYWYTDKAIHMSMAEYIQANAVIAWSNIIWFCIWYNSEGGKICISGYIHKRNPTTRPHGQAVRCLSLQWCHNERGGVSDH